MTGDSSWATFPFVVNVSDLVDETLDELAGGIEIDIDEHQASNTIPTRLLLLRLSLSVSPLWSHQSHSLTPLLTYY